MSSESKLKVLKASQKKTTHKDRSSIEREIIDKKIINICRIEREIHFSADLTVCLVEKTPFIVEEQKCEGMQSKTVFITDGKRNIF